jgi:aminoglycoside phosphotransferase
MTAMLAPDAAVPQRDLLLDGVAVADRLAEALGAPIGRCEPIRARYQVGRSLRVLYALDGDLVALRTFPGARSREVYERARPTARTRAGLPAVAHDPELGAVLFAFPNDRKLSGLRVLADRASRIVAYAPEKCATARLDDPDGRAVAYAKAYATEDGARTRAFHDALREPAAAAGLQVPRVLGYSAARRTITCEAVAGVPLARMRERESGLRELGRALALLHGLVPPPGAPPFATRTAEAVATITAARPDCAASARDVVTRLEATVPRPGPVVCLHGDVHLKNAVDTGDGVALIDLDQLAAGPAAADVGSLLAALRYGRLTGELTAAAERAHADAFLAGYATVREVPEPGTLRWHLAAALLAERAARAVTRVRPAGLAVLPELLAEAIGEAGG